MRKRAAESQKYVLNKLWKLTHPYLSRTCEAPAQGEIHFLHALGEHELANVTCEREGEERKKDQTRDKEACAAGRKNVLNKI